MFGWHHWCEIEKLLLQGDVIEQASFLKGMQIPTAINSDFLFARPLDDAQGYTWTLTSRLGSILKIAEQRFGSRDASYTLLGFEFGGDVPQIWYPGNSRHVIIQITPECANDIVRACYQLSHECIHLLAPSGGRNANNLEEGLATHFSHWYLWETFKINYPCTIASYQVARDAVEELLAIDTNVVRLLRERQPAFYLLTPADIVAVTPNVRTGLAEFLCKHFNR